jgi:hypothetical protein
MTDGADNEGVKRELLTLISKSDRGAVNEFSSRIKALLETLENTTPNEQYLASIPGKWELLWSNDDVTRASPFFWAFRKATKDLKDPFGLLGQELLSESIFKITDNIPLKTVGPCWQTFSGDSLKSEVVVEVGLKSSFSISSSVMTTTSKCRYDDQDPTVMELTVEKTQVLNGF